MPKSTFNTPLYLLHIVQFSVITVFGNQLLMGASLHNSALMQYAYLVGILDGAQAVSHSYGGASLHQLFQGILY